MIYADTSVLAAMVTHDEFSLRTKALLAGVRSPLVLTDLLRLEVGNAVRLAVGGGRLDERHGQLAVNKIEALIGSGGWVEVAVDWERVFGRAKGLSVAHSSSLGARSLDILHVACAMDLGVGKFWSFDRRQRTLAERVGLNVNPLDI
jgi:predicted nucleic acid-binding protein